ncbi:MAG: ABC transporter ATP-binding protein [Candidatus Woesearchaeota archaeon]
MELVLNVKNLNKKYGNIVALNNVSLEVKKNKLIGLLGPNGSGKSTLIKILTGQLKPDSGIVEVLGIDVLKNPVKVREISGIIPEQENPPSFLTAQEYLEFVLTIRNKLDSLKDIDFWFEFLDFQDTKNRLCKDLSRGERQKLMFAQAFIHKPKIAFIDEPIINLDPITQKRLLNFLEEYKKQGTIFMTTHVLELAEKICDEVYIIKDGNILAYLQNTKNLEKKYFDLLEQKTRKSRK